MKPHETYVDASELPYVRLLQMAKREGFEPYQDNGVTRFRKARKVNEMTSDLIAEIFGND